MESRARRLIENDDEDSVVLGPTPTKSVTVAVEVSGDGAENFRQFVETLASICNAGCSRRLVIEDPSDEKERACSWSFDGDGNTKIKVHAAEDAE